MDFRQIFVLAEVRLTVNISYDRLHTMVNNDTLLRTVMGIEREAGFEKQTVDYQQILDNLSLFCKDTMRKINNELVNLGTKCNVELVKNVAITTDQFNLIIDFKIMKHETDSEIIIAQADRILQRHTVESWSFDKGYYNKTNKELPGLYIPHLVMPKKGKTNQTGKEEKHQRHFIKLRYKHNAIEDNINELEHRGLVRSYDHFLHYTTLGVCAYNLRKLGAKLIEQNRVEFRRPKTGKNMCIIVLKSK